MDRKRNCLEANLLQVVAECLSLWPWKRGGSDWWIHSDIDSLTPRELCGLFAKRTRRKKEIEQVSNIRCVLAICWSSYLWSIFKRGLRILQTLLTQLDDAVRGSVHFLRIQHAWCRRRRTERRTDGLTYPLKQTRECIKRERCEIRFLFTLQEHVFFLLSLILTPFIFTPL